MCPKTRMVVSHVSTARKARLGIEYCHRLALFLLVMFLGDPTLRGNTVALFVSPAGNDIHDGSFEKPFRTLERARDTIRARRKDPGLSDPVTVYLRQGTFRLSRAFELTRQDSGREDAPVIFRPWNNELVIVSGAKQVSGFEPARDDQLPARIPDPARQHVRIADLRKEGLTNLGHAVRIGRRPELFFNNRAMSLARWPNEGFARVQEVTGGQPFTTHGLKGDRSGRFTYEGSRPERWKEEPEIWLHGYWFWDWSDAWQRIEQIDPPRKTITLSKPHHNYGYRPGQRFYAANLLSELDQAGEWYLNRETSLLYFWPPGPLDQSIVELSVQETLVTMRDTSWVRFQGLVLESARATAVIMEGGAHNLLTGCLIRNTGSWGVRISGGRSHGVAGCDIQATGEGGISLRGGDRTTLTPGSHQALNNHIHHFGRLQRTYRPAVGIGGVGQRVAHNLIHDGPHNAIQLGGNDHRIEYNEIHHVCLETGDVGAFYTGRDWTTRGTVIRHNYFHDIQGRGRHGAMAVYLDDSASGFSISGNLFVRAGRAAFIGGGRDNLVENNVFVDCQPSVHVDARGLGWMKYHVDPGGTLPERLKAMPYRRPPWSERYPQLLNLLQDDPGAPKGNVIRLNVSAGGTWSHIEKIARSMVTIKDNLVNPNPGFQDREKENFQFRDDSPVWKLGFKRIPVEQIGLQSDAHRKSLPVLKREPRK
ncbi:MAG: hypothetical protein CMP31_01635 [Roseibacillus sp.]|nr:hypothetical protein [Roseibacillus sp.]